MIVGKLRVSFDRGVATNKAPDLGLDAIPEKTTDGGRVRGAGTHYRDDQAELTAKELEREEGRIRAQFRRVFLAASIPGFWVLPEAGAGKALLDSLAVDSRVAAHVREFVIVPTEPMAPADLVEWGEKIKSQIADVPLGNKKDASAGGLEALARLANCPILSDATRTELLALIADTKLGALTRVELKRELKLGLAVEIDYDEFAEAPRRVARSAPVDMDVTEVAARQVRRSANLDTPDGSDDAPEVGAA